MVEFVDKETYGEFVGMWDQGEGFVLIVGYDPKYDETFGFTCRRDGEEGDVLELDGGDKWYVCTTPEYLPGKLGMMEYMRKSNEEVNGKSE